jgi:hypothetical protein
MGGLIPRISNLLQIYGRFADGAFDPTGKMPYTLGEARGRQICQHNEESVWRSA